MLVPFKEYTVSFELGPLTPELTVLLLAQQRAKASGDEFLATYLFGPRLVDAFGRPVSLPHPSQ